MNIEEHRKHKRIDSTNLLNYVCLDEKGEGSTQGMGRTLNVSESGILLETHVPVEAGTIISLTLGMEEEIIDIKGTAVYSKKNDQDSFETGIEFSGIRAAELAVLQRFVTEFEKNV